MVVVLQRREQLYLTSLGNDKHDVDADIDDDCDSVSQLKMSSSSSSSPSSLPAELRALLDHERSRRRAAEDWATFLVATLDSYVRASNTYERRLAESGLGPQAAHSQYTNSDARYQEMSDDNIPSHKYRDTDIPLSDMDHTILPANYTMAAFPS